VPAALLAVELLVCEFRVRFVMKGGQVVRRAAPSSRCIESAPEHHAHHFIFTQCLNDMLDLCQQRKKENSMRHLRARARALCNLMSGVP
jgi:hypothetical protein